MLKFILISILSTFIWANEPIDCMKTLVELAQQRQKNARFWTYERVERAKELLLKNSHIWPSLNVVYMRNHKISEDTLSEVNNLLQEEFGNKAEIRSLFRAITTVDDKVHPQLWPYVLANLGIPKHHVEKGARKSSKWFSGTKEQNDEIRKKVLLYLKSKNDLSLFIPHNLKKNDNSQIEKQITELVGFDVSLNGLYQAITKDGHNWEARDWWDYLKEIGITKRSVDSTKKRPNQKWDPTQYTEILHRLFFTSWSRDYILNNPESNQQDHKKLDDFVSQLAGHKTKFKIFYQHIDRTIGWEKAILQAGIKGLWQRRKISNSGWSQYAHSDQNKLLRAKAIYSLYDDAKNREYLLLKNFLGKKTTEADKAISNALGFDTTVESLFHAVTIASKYWIPRKWYDFLNEIDIDIHLVRYGFTIEQRDTALKKMIEDKTLSKRLNFYHFRNTTQSNAVDFIQKELGDSVTLQDVLNSMECATNKVKFYEILFKLGQQAPPFLKKWTLDKIKKLYSVVFNHPEFKNYMGLYKMKHYSPQGMNELLSKAAGHDVTTDSFVSAVIREMESQGIKSWYKFAEKNGISHLRPKKIKRWTDLQLKEASYLLFLTYPDTMKLSVGRLMEGKDSLINNILSSILGRNTNSRQFMFSLRSTLFDKDIRSWYQFLDSIGLDSDLIRYGMSKEDRDNMMKALASDPSFETYLNFYQFYEVSPGIVNDFLKGKTNNNVNTSHVVRSLGIRTTQQWNSYLKQLGSKLYKKRFKWSFNKLKRVAYALYSTEDMRRFLSPSQLIHADASVDQFISHYADMPTRATTFYQAVRRWLLFKKSKGKISDASWYTFLKAIDIPFEDLNLKNTKIKNMTFDQAGMTRQNDYCEENFCQVVNYGNSQSTEDVFMDELEDDIQNDYRDETLNVIDELTQSFNSVQKIAVNFLLDKVLDNPLILADLDILKDILYFDEGIEVSINDLQEILVVFKSEEFYLYLSKNISN